MDAQIANQLVVGLMVVTMFVVISGCIGIIACLYTIKRMKKRK